jgi:hypothetical protein
MEPLDLDAYPWGRRGRLCNVHGWGCPNRVTLVQGPSSSSRQGEEEGGEEDDERRITVVTGPVEAPVIHRTPRISVGPQGRPQGPLAPWTETMSPTSPTLVAPPPAAALPSPKVGMSGSGTPSDLLSLCSNRVLWRFTRFVTPSGKGRVLRSWDSMAGPSR